MTSSTISLRPLPIDSLLKLLSSTVGRDKLYRLLQYLSKFLAFYLGKMSPSMEFVKRLQKLSLSLGMARKGNKLFCGVLNFDFHSILALASLLSF